MARFARGTLSVFRNDPLWLVIELAGVIVDGATALSFAVKLRPDSPGAPIIHLTNGAGITVLDSATDGAGNAHSTIALAMDKAAFEAALAPYQAAESGGDVILACDLQWTPPVSLVAPFPAVEATILVGQFIVMGSVND